MKYSAAGTAEAVDAAEVVVGAWPVSSAITLDLGATSMLRHLAVAIHQGHHGWDLQRLGEYPFDAATLDHILPCLLADRRVTNALVHTMTLADAETLRDALTDAIAVLTERADDYREDVR